ncbi:MAG: hypothetical protein AMXMBFR47_35060 [Planctomycetota bacterium]
MFGPRIKLDKALYDRARAMAEKAGYSSVDEFVVNMIEKELARLEGPENEDQGKLEERLRGLGYIE